MVHSKGAMKTASIVMMLFRQLVTQHDMSKIAQKTTANYASVTSVEIPGP